VELDIQTTRDGRFVVHHDAEAQGLVIPAATLEDVRRLRLPNGEPIPTLEEALAGILPDLLAFVEVKTLPAEHDAALLAVLDASSAPARAAVHAFDHRIPHRLRRRRPDLATGVLAVAYAVDPVRAALDAGAKALWQHWETVDQGLVATAHAAGLVVYAWSEGAMPLRRLVELGVDGLCTDHPDEGRLAVDSPVL
jgi:glycerophosphoryl diester phosphodiesterase